MTTLPDFSKYTPVELSQVKPGDVVAAVLDGSIIHGEVTYANKEAVDFSNGFNTTAKGDYTFFKAPKQLPTGDCAVIVYEKNSYKKRAVLMGESWFFFEVYSQTGDLIFWDHPSIEFTPEELQNETTEGFTVLFEGVKK